MIASESLFFWVWIYLCSSASMILFLYITDYVPLFIWIRIYYRSSISMIFLLCYSYCCGFFPLNPYVTLFSFLNICINNKQLIMRTSTWKNLQIYINNQVTLTPYSIFGNRLLWLGTTVLKFIKNETIILQGHKISLTKFHKANARTNFPWLTLIFVWVGTGFSGWFP